MKKTISFIIVTIILLSVVIAEQIYIDKTLDDLILKIDTLNTQTALVENINTEEINKTAEDLDDFWTKNEDILCVLVNHNDLTKIGEEIKKIKVYIKDNNKDDFVYELDTLKFYATTYKDVFQLNIQNLL